MLFYYVALMHGYMKFCFFLEPNWFISRMHGCYLFPFFPKKIAPSLWQSQWILKVEYKHFNA